MARVQLIPSELLTGDSAVVPLFYFSHRRASMRGSRGRGRQGTGPPPEISQSYRFLSNTGPDPLKNHKLPSQHSMLGHHWPASEPHLNGVRWRVDDGPLLMVFGSLDPLPSSTKTKQNVRVGSPLTKFSGYAHDGQYVHIQTQNAPRRTYCVPNLHDTVDILLFHWSSKSN